MVPGEYKVQKKKKAKIPTKIDLTKELKNLWDMVGTMLTIVIDVLGTVSKCWKKELTNLRS